jgi:regulator of replication initiation timing
MTFDCPFCGYESDTRGGVEAHISGKSDSSHEGKVGRMYRSEIEQESQPDGLVGRLRQQVGENPKLQSVLEEVRRYEESHQEELEELREENEELRERLDRLEEGVQSHREKTNSWTDVGGPGVGDRLDLLEERQEVATKLLRWKLYRDRDTIECPNCGFEEVKLTTDTGRQLGESEELEVHRHPPSCPNCETVPMDVTAE